jgi:hypothetical protein
MISNVMVCVFDEVEAVSYTPSGTRLIQGSESLMSKGSVIPNPWRFQSHGEVSVHTQWYWIDEGARVLVSCRLR